MLNMFTTMLGIRLEPELEEKLDSLAKETGRSKSYYAREAIRQYLEDREDYLKGIAAAGAPRTYHHVSKSWSAAWSGRLKLPGPPKGRSKGSTVPAQKSIVRFLRERLKSAENPRQWGKPLPWR